MQLTTEYGGFKIGQRVRLSPHYFEVYGGCQQRYGEVVGVPYHPHRKGAKGVKVMFDGNTTGIPASYHANLLELARAPA